VAEAGAASAAEAAEAAEGLPALLDPIGAYQEIWTESKSNRNRNPSNRIEMENRNRKSMEIEIEIESNRYVEPDNRIESFESKSALIIQRCLIPAHE